MSDRKFALVLGLVEQPKHHLAPAEKLAIRIELRILPNQLHQCPG